MTADPLAALADHWEADAEFVEAGTAGTKVRRSVAAEVWRGCASELRAALAAAPPADSLRFDHDGTFRHHHDSDTAEPIWWLNADPFGGEKREHQHHHAAPPAESLDVEHTHGERTHTHRYMSSPVLSGHLAIWHKP